MLKSRVTYLVAVAVLVVGLTAILAVIGHESTQQGLDRQKASRKWHRFVSEGLREKGPRDLPHWPFSSIHRTVPMPLQLRAEAYAILGKPEHFGMRFEDARHAFGPHGMSLWVVPGQGVVCMFPAEEVAAACRTNVQADRHGLLLQTYKRADGGSHQPVSFTVLGLAPDGIKQVRMKFGNTWRTIPVHRNMYTAQADVPISVAPVTPPSGR